MSHYKFITEHTKHSLNKPHDTDVIYYSELQQWYTSEALRSFSIKFVLENTIRYSFGNVDYDVQPMKYLVTIKQPGVKAFFDTPGNVKSICIDICPQTVREVFTLLTEKSDQQIENYLANYFTEPDFLESVSRIDNSVMGNKLQHLACMIKQNKQGLPVNKEWFYELMEAVVYQEYGNYIRLENINCLKASTRKEIFRRVRIAKEYIDEHYLYIQGITELARTCLMSEYHFFRSFKQIYSITPHQYLLQKKLSVAREMIHNSNYKLSDIATICGFPDSASFSKSFKKHFSTNPSSYKKKNIS